MAAGGAERGGGRDAAERSRRTGSGPRTSRCLRVCPQRDGRGGVGGAAAYGVPKSWRSEMVFSWRAVVEVEGGGGGSLVAPCPLCLLLFPNASHRTRVAERKGKQLSLPGSLLAVREFFNPLRVCFFFFFCDAGVVVLGFFYEQRCLCEN